MSDEAQVYFESRDRLCDFALSLDVDQLAVHPPATPDWTVTDVLAHVTGIIDDSLAGNLDGVGSEAWTAAQVARRADMTVGEIVDDWRRLTEDARATLESLPAAVTVTLIGDLVTHEHDVRGGLANRGARGTAAVELGLEYYARQFTKKVLNLGLAPVRLRAGDREWMRGDDEPLATVTAEPFELLRALTGRRTSDEVTALDWDGDSAPFVEVFSFYGWPEVSLGE